MHYIINKTNENYIHNNIGYALEIGVVKPSFVS